ncbi:MAG: hypothetical protein WCV81_05030 [Microgenomates group bacterium]|jgi:hypothetical protein
MASETRVNDCLAKKLEIGEITGILNGLVEKRGWTIDQGWFLEKTREEKWGDPEYAHLRKVSLQRVDQLKEGGAFLLSNPLDIGEGYNPRYFISLGSDCNGSGVFFVKITKLAPETPDKNLVRLSWEDMMEEIRLDGRGTRKRTDFLHIASKENPSDEFMSVVMESFKMSDSEIKEELELERIGKEDRKGRLRMKRALDPRNIL